MDDTAQIVVGFYTLQDDPSDAKAKDLAVVLYETAVIRSGFALKVCSSTRGKQNLQS